MNIETIPYLFANIFLLSNKLQILGDNYLEEITVKQWLLLMMIKVNQLERPSIKEVADLIGSTRQNTKKMLESLQKKGYVALQQNLTDKRSLSVILTDKTHLFFNQFEHKGTIFVEQLFAGTKQEQLESMRETVNILFKNIDKMEAGINGKFEE